MFRWTVPLTCPLGGTACAVTLARTAHENAANGLVRVGCGGTPRRTPPRAPRGSGRRDLEQPSHDQILSGSNIESERGASQRPCYALPHTSAIHPDLRQRQPGTITQRNCPLSIILGVITAAIALTVAAPLTDWSRSPLRKPSGHAPHYSAPRHAADYVCGLRCHRRSMQRSSRTPSSRVADHPASGARNIPHGPCRGSL
jgi:hypothetical protein